MLEEGAAVLRFARAHHVQVPTGLDAWRPAGESQFWHGREGLVVGLGDAAPGGDERAELAHLARPEGRLDVGEAVVVAEGLLLVPPRALVGVPEVGGVASDAVRTEGPCSTGDVSVVGDDSPSFCSGDWLDRMEGEGAG